MLPTENTVFMYIVKFLRYTEIICLKIKQLVIVMETQGVSCEAWIEFLNIIHMYFVLQRFNCTQSVLV
jgi:hypothetical protein